MSRKSLYTVFFVVLTYLAGTAFPGTVLQYSFDGTLDSNVPSGLVDDTGTYTAEIIEGTDVNSAITYAEANPIYNSSGTSAEFYNEVWSNNAGDTFLVPNSGGIDFSTFDKFTIELFVYPDSAGSGNTRRIFSEYIYAYTYLDGSNTLHAIRKWGGGKWNENWTHLMLADFPHDEWSHIAMTWDANGVGDRLKLYVDGDMVVSDVGSADPTIDSTAGFAIGGYQREDTAGSTAQFFHGKIDEFRLSDVALDASEFLLYGAFEGVATRPNPHNSATGLAPEVVLSWTPGPFASTHEVYFGANWDDVNDADELSAEYKGSQNFDANSYDPPGELDLGTTYYWRIDEANGPAKWKGIVWRFATDEGKASGPYPENGEFLVPLDVVLGWVPGIRAASHDVYFGTDFNNVNDATTGNHPNVEYENVDVNSYDPPGDLDYLTRYYWRIDEVVDGQTVKGDIWNFKTTGFIVDPNLIVWFRFDETEGSTVVDSSGHGFDGEVRLISTDAPTASAWDSVGYDGKGCIAFDGDIKVVVPAQAFDKVESAVTVSLWVNGDESVHPDPNWGMPFHGRGGTNNYLLYAHIPTKYGGVMLESGARNTQRLIWEEATPTDWEGDWNHYAFTVDPNQQMVKIHHNGREVAWNDLASLGVGGIDSFTIGCGIFTNGTVYEYFGKVDDFRIYDYALQEAEIGEFVKFPQASRPYPSNEAEDVPWDVVLSWTPGRYAADAGGQDVYSGTNWDDVNDGNPSSSVFIGNQDANSYDPGGLELETSYYWRIDEVNDANVDSPWKGRVWSFTVADYVTMDDMESYCPGVSSCAINGTWLDWEYGDDTGAEAKLGEGPQGHPVRRGDQSLEFNYDNDNPFGSPKYSEVKRELNPSEDFTDWTVLDLKALRLYFYGDPNNDANATEQMYVGLEDNVGTYVEVRYGDDGEDMNDLRESRWHMWNIALPHFAGVDLSNVRTVYVGFGNREVPKAGGNGMVYFDDIRLYPPTCLPSVLKPEKDLNDDCIVDFGDLEVMAQDWLKAGLTTVSADAPDSSKLVLQYLFDETDGTTVADNTGNGYTGTFFIDVNQIPAEISERIDGGRSGNSFHFSARIAHGGISVPNDVFVDNGISQEITVSAWIKNSHPNELPDAGAFMWEFRQWDGVSTSEGARVLAVETDDRNDAFVLRDDGGRIRYEQDWDDVTDWTSFIFTRDANNLKIYVDGLKKAEGASSGNPMAVPGLLYVGISSDQPPGYTGGIHDGFTGNMDDFRVYSYALSYSEVVGLAEQSSVYDAVDSEANFYEPGFEEIIDFKDYAVLINVWLEQRLWPEE